MKNSLKTAFAAIAVSVVAFAFSGRASAVETLTLSDGLGDSVTIYDNNSSAESTTGAVTNFGSGGDSNPVAGAITWLGSIGVWEISVTTGNSYPALGTASSPQMNLSSQDTSTAAGSLTITFTDTGYTLAPGGVTAVLSVNSSGGSVDFKTMQNSTVITNSGALTGAPIGMTDYGALASNVTPYSLTEQVVITNSGAAFSDIGAKMSVPDGGMTVALLGLSLVGIAGAKTLRRKLAE